MRISVLLISTIVLVSNCSAAASSKDEGLPTPLLSKLLNKLKIFLNLFHLADKKTDSPPPQVLALNIATSNWKAQSIRTFILSGLAGAMEELCVGGKFVTATDIAHKAGMKPNPTYRLLRFLSTFDVCVEGPNRDFTLGPIGEVLTPNNPQSVAKAVLWEASLTPALIWDQLLTFIRDDRHVAPEVLQTESVWSYLHNHPEIQATFLGAMTGYSNEESFFLSNPALSPSFDLKLYSTIVDLGCAEGRLALALAQRFPDAKYILADLSDAVKRLDPTKLPNNFSVEATNFLVEQPPKADAYLLKHVIHDWNDEQSAIIFGNIKKANPDATVFILEFGPMPGPNVP